MHDFHGPSLPSTRTPAVSVVGRAGKFKNLTLGLEGTNPRFPWKPSATMLTYRLKAPQRQSGSTTTNQTSVHPASNNDSGDRRQSSPTMVRPKTAPRC
jgi:hypothetical protein